VLYLAGGRFRIGAPADVMTSEVLSDLYDSPVEVLHHEGRIIVVGLPGTPTAHHHHHPAREA
jgi:zinc/manganese transport system ATP-binding protein